PWVKVGKLRHQVKLCCYPGRDMIVKAVRIRQNALGRLRTIATPCVIVLPPLLLVPPCPIRSDLLNAKRLEFCAADHTEFAKEIDRPAIDHLPQLKESFVRRQIAIDDLSSDFFGAFENLCRRQDAHSAYLCVKPDQGGNVCLIVLERMDIAFRGL